MTEKMFTQSEINEITNTVFILYNQIFQADRMSFDEWLLVKNVILEIQQRLNEYDGDVE